MTGPHQHPTILGDQRKDVPGSDEIRSAGIAVREVADRRRAVLGRNPGRRAMAVIDRNRKRRAVDGVAVRDHRRQMQTPRDLPGQRRADDAAGVANDERHLLWCRVYRSKDQVAFVLAVVIIGYDDDLSSGECFDYLRNTGLGHGLISRRADRLAEAVGGQKPRICLAELGDGEPPQDLASVALACIETFENAPAKVACKTPWELVFALTRSPLLDTVFCSAPFRRASKRDGRSGNLGRVKYFQFVKDLLRRALTGNGFALGDRHTVGDDEQRVRAASPPAGVHQIIQKHIAGVERQ
jgi:hypothetical protein